MLWISLAGAVGTLARYGLSGLIQRTHGLGFPWGTLAVNVVGCFLFGMLWSLTENRLILSPEIRIIIFIGFLGSFTTFSSFAFETSQLLRDAQWGLALANIMAQNLLGLLFLFLGFATGRIV